MYKDVLGRVFCHPRYVIGAGLVGFAVVSTGMLLPNVSVVSQVAFSDSITLGAKISFLVSMYGSLFTNFTLYSALYLLLIAILFGINIGLLTFYVRRRQVKANNTTAHMASIGGIVSAALGIGCAACGSVVVTTILGLFGATGFLVLLPFKGAEFGFIGLILLLVSIVYLIKRIDDPIVCPAKY